MADAACREIGGEPFFPEENQNTAAEKAVCRRCDVVDACLEFALSTNQQFGVWGATTYQDRLRIKRERRGNAA